MSSNPILCLIIGRKISYNEYFLRDGYITQNIAHFNSIAQEKSLQFVFKNAKKSPL